MEIRKVAVIGGGTMGNGIAHVFAMKGFEVYLTEMDEDLYKRAMNIISGNLDRQLKKQVITEDEKRQTLSKINKVIGVENVPSDINLIIEAIFENKDVKLTIFKQLEIKLIMIVSLHPILRRFRLLNYLLYVDQINLLVCTL